MIDLRRQDTKNRQNSIDDIDPFVKQEFEIKIKRHFEEGMKLYKEMLNSDIAKECARLSFLLPLLLGFTCLGLAVLGFTISNFARQMGRRKSTWILQRNAKRFS